MYCEKHNQISQEHCRECEIDGYKAEIKNLMLDLNVANRVIQDHRKWMKETLEKVEVT